MAEEEILLVYDMECPACDTYCRLVRIRDAEGKLKLVNAREPGPVMAEITARGFDIDQGMVLKMGGQLYYGSDAIHALALISNRSGVFNRINHWVFKSGVFSRVIYPVLRFCRNLLLKILGKSKINNLELENNEKF